MRRERNPEIRPNPDLPLFQQSESMDELQDRVAFHRKIGKLEQAHARRDDPATSKQAALSVTNLGRVREGILEIFREHGQLIDEDLVEIYHNRENTRGYKFATDQSIRSRRKELERDFGKLVCCGAKENKRKRMSQVWRLK